MDPFFLCKALGFYTDPPLDQVQSKWWIDLEKTKKKEEERTSALVLLPPSSECWLSCPYLSVVFSPGFSSQQSFRPSPPPPLLQSPPQAAASWSRSSSLPLVSGSPRFDPELFGSEIGPDGRPLLLHARLRRFFQQQQQQQQQQDEERGFFLRPADLFGESHRLLQGCLKGEMRMLKVAPEEEQPSRSLLGSPTSRTPPKEDLVGEKKAVKDQPSEWPLLHATHVGSTTSTTTAPTDAATTTTMVTTTTTSSAGVLKDDGDDSTRELGGEEDNNVFSPPDISLDARHTDERPKNQELTGRAGSPKIRATIPPPSIHAPAPRAAPSSLSLPSPPAVTKEHPRCHEGTQEGMGQSRATTRTDCESLVDHQESQDTKLASCSSFNLIDTTTTRATSAVSSAKTPRPMGPGEAKGEQPRTKEISCDRRFLLVAGPPRSASSFPGKKDRRKIVFSRRYVPPWRQQFWFNKLKSLPVCNGNTADCFSHHVRMGLSPSDARQQREEGEVEGKETRTPSTGMEAACMKSVFRINGRGTGKPRKDLFLSLARTLRRDGGENEKGTRDTVEETVDDVADESFFEEDADTCTVQRRRRSLSIQLSRQDDKERRTRCTADPRRDEDRAPISFATTLDELLLLLGEGESGGQGGRSLAASFKRMHSDRTKCVGTALAGREDDDRGVLTPLTQCTASFSSSSSSLFTPVVCSSAASTHRGRAGDG